MISYIRKHPNISKNNKSYYVIGRVPNHLSNIPKPYEFLSSPIKSREMDIYKTTLNDNYFYPNTVLYVFDKDYNATNFYRDVSSMSPEQFPIMETITHRLCKGHIIVKTKQPNSNTSTVIQIVECNFEDILQLTKNLRSNLFIIQKYRCYEPDLHIYGTFLPILLEYNKHLILK